MKTTWIRCRCGHEGLAPTAMGDRLRCSACGGKDWKPIGRPNRVYQRPADIGPQSVHIRLPEAPEIDPSTWDRGEYP